MGWDRKRAGPTSGYYYRSVRTPEGVRKVYFGRGATQWAAAAVELRRQDRQRAKDAVRAERDATAEADRLADELREWASTLLAAWLGLAGLHCHKGCWRIKRDKGK